MSRIKGHRTPLAAGRDLPCIAQPFLVVPISQPASYDNCTVQRASCTYRTRTAGAAFTGQGRGSGENLHTSSPVNNPPLPQEKTPRSPSAQNSCPVAAPISTTTPPRLNQILPARLGPVVHSTRAYTALAKAKANARAVLSRTLFRSAHTLRRRRLCQRPKPWWMHAACKQLPFPLDRTCI